MDERLRQAAEDGDIEAFYRLVGTDPSILEQIDERLSFVETPLHVAASLGHTEFAMEMMRLKPSFARKPNQDGFTPIHLALLQNENISQQLLVPLLQVDPDLIRVKGREGETPLHYVARKGNLHLLAEFLLVCPDSIKDVTIRSETALHIALKHNKLEAFRVLLGWLDRAAYDNTLGLKETILNLKNNEGNTVLHIATSNSLRQVVRALLRSGAAVNEKNLRGLTALDILERQSRSLEDNQVINKDMWNLRGLTALDILERQRALDNQEIKDMFRRAKALRASAIDTKSITLADYLRSKGPFNESVLKYVFHMTFYMPNDQRNAFLVVAVLIATATYQAGLSPPGGVWQDDYIPSPDLNTTTTTTTTTISPSSSRHSPPPPPHEAGKSLLPPVAFFLIYLFNSTAFCLSMAIIYILLPIGPGGVVLRCTLMVLNINYMVCMVVISKFQVGLIVLCLSCIPFIFFLRWIGAVSILDRNTHMSPGARRIGTLPDLVWRKAGVLLY